MSDWSAFEPALRATAAHHGRPISQTHIDRCARGVQALWAPIGLDDPITALAPLGAAVKRWFPAAFEPGDTPLPDQPEFWHAYAGLVMLADWIGSDTQSFPLISELTASGADRTTSVRPR